MDRCASLIYKVGYFPLLDRELTLRVEGFDEVGIRIVSDIYETNVESGVDTASRDENISISC